MIRRTIVKSETITVSTTAIGLTATYLDRATGVNKVLMYVESNPIRYWRSGLAPTSTTGFPAFDGNILEFDIGEAANLKMIRSGGADAKVHVEYIAESADK